jgi:hypoxanthine-DNA glycosylase
MPAGTVPAASAPAGRIRGFAPIIGSRPRVLILGSMPSVASLDKAEYYGKSQNAFWRIMGELFAAGPELAYSLRVKKLGQAGVAVWDVLASCVRPGSLDSAIDMRTAEVNDVAALLAARPGINSVFFNGRKAQQIFRSRLYKPVKELRPELSYHVLPSTSPAMATLDFSAKLAAWRVVRAAVE